MASSKKPTVSSPANNLPDDVLVDIFARVASCSIKDLHSLRRVAKRFHRVSYDSRVLAQASLDCSMFRWDKIYFYLDYPAFWPFFQHNYEAFIYRCLETKENPHAVTALYRLGVKQFFKCPDDNMQPQAERGLKNIATAAEKGLEIAIKVYGLILITRGGEFRDKGYELLKAYTIAYLTPTEVLRFEAHWNEILYSMEYMPCDHVSIHIKERYVRDNCQCDGMTSRWLAFYIPSLWRFGEFEGLPTSKACEACQWHVLVYEIFRFRMIVFE